MEVNPAEYQYQTFEGHLLKVGIAGQRRRIMFHRQYREVTGSFRFRV
jgi:hypothetical protein